MTGSPVTFCIGAQRQCLNWPAETGGEVEQRLDQPIPAKERYDVALSDACEVV